MVECGRQSTVRASSGSAWGLLISKVELLRRPGLLSLIRGYTTCCLGSGTTVCELFWCYLLLPHVFAWLASFRGLWNSSVPICWDFAA